MFVKDVVELQLIKFILPAKFVIVFARKGLKNGTLIIFKNRVSRFKS